MFNWANKQLERLSQTVAPPPTDALHRFSTAIRSNDFDNALALLSQSDDPVDPYAVVTMPWGSGALPIHLCAHHGASAVLASLIQTYHVRPEAFDAVGNTPLHYAAASNHPESVPLAKTLVVDYHVSVTVKNAMGQTPYDVAVLQTMRQFLLPLQLQKETMDCIQNNGQLPQGTDMGGMRSTVPPPPIPRDDPPYHNTTSAFPQGHDFSTHSASHQQYQVQPPYVNANAMSYNQASTDTFVPNSTVSNFDRVGDTSATTSFHVTSDLQNAKTSFPLKEESAGIRVTRANDNQNAMSSAEIMNESNMQPAAATTLVPKISSIPEPVLDLSEATTTSIPAPQSGTLSKPQSKAPSSREYARSGYSSAAILREPSCGSAGRRIYKPDGFHSSSSDVSLQEKYGHVQISGGPPSSGNVPPPPSSGSGPSALVEPQGNHLVTGETPAPPSTETSYHNPYTAGAAVRPSYGSYGTSVLGGRNRYPSYDPISNTTNLGGIAAVYNPYPSYPSGMTMFNPASVGSATVSGGNTKDDGLETRQNSSYQFSATGSSETTLPTVPVQHQQTGGQQLTREYPQHQYATGQQHSEQKVLPTELQQLENRNYQNPLQRSQQQQLHDQNQRHGHQQHHHRQVSGDVAYSPSPDPSFPRDKSTTDDDLQLPYNHSPAASNLAQRHEQAPQLHQSASASAGDFFASPSSMGSSLAKTAAPKVIIPSAPRSASDFFFPASSEDETALQRDACLSPASDFFSAGTPPNVSAPRAATPASGNKTNILEKSTISSAPMSAGDFFTLGENNDKSNDKHNFNSNSTSVPHIGASNADNVDVGTLSPHLGLEEVELDGALLPPPPMSSPFESVDYDDFGDSADLPPPPMMDILLTPSVMK